MDEHRWATKVMTNSKGYMTTRELFWGLRTSKEGDAQLLNTDHISSIYDLSLIAGKSNWT